MKHLFALILTLCVLNSAALAETNLTIFDGNDSYFLNDYIERHNDVNLISMAPNAWGPAYMNDLLTNPDYDVYQMTLGTTFRRMMEEGYLMPIDDTFSLDWLASCYPALAEALSYNGELFGLPAPEDSSSGIIAWSYSPEAINEAGLSNLPQTWVELLSLMINWDIDSPYRVFDQDSVEELNEIILREYILRYEVPGQPLSFDTDAFRTTMEALNAWSKIRIPADDRPALINPQSIMFGEEGGKINSELTFFPPVTFLDDEEPIVSIDVLQIWCISRRTKHDEIARNLLSEAAEFMPEHIRFMTVPGSLHPIEKLLSQKTVDEVDALMCHFTVDMGSVFGSHLYEMLDIVPRYIEGNMSIDMLIKQLDNFVEMITLEQT